MMNNIYKKFLSLPQAEGAPSSASWLLPQLTAWAAQDPERNAKLDRLFGQLTRGPGKDART